jgi:AcrR family transcriptional regulator
MAAPQTARATLDDGRRARRRRELHGRILDAARTLFREHGFAATRVEEIAAAADIAPATFFNHFPTKEHVLREMATAVSDRVSALLDEQRRRPASTATRLAGFAARGATLVQRAPELTRRVLLEALHAPSPESERQLAGIHQRMTELVRAGQTRRDVRHDVPAEFLAELLAGAVNHAMMRWIHDPKYPLADRLGRSLAFLAGAIRPAKG